MMHGNKTHIRSWSEHIDNTLYFFDAFSKEWEEFNYNFNILNKKEIKEIKRKLEVI